ncbi:PHP domain-containing protein [Catenulispora yoronensis]
MLPPDNHVHSEFSWDAFRGSMEATCERAVEIGLPSLAFTEHADFSVSTLPPDFVLPEQWEPHTAHHPDGARVLTPRTSTWPGTWRRWSGAGTGSPACGSCRGWS